MVEHEKSEEREKAEKSPELLPLTATPGEFARIYLGIPEDVQGLVIVDFASGASSLVPQLLAVGADAHAVDPIYRLTSDELLKRLKEALNDIFTTNKKTPKKGRALWTSSQQAMGEFVDSYKASPERYQAGYLPHLDRRLFPDNFADMTVSLHGISQFGENPQILFQSVAEAMRITKPGGIFVMAPIRILPSGKANEEGKSYKALLDQMWQFGHVDTEKDISIPNRPDQPTMNRLTIIKPNHF